MVRSRASGWSPAPSRDSEGQPHPHIEARFHVRAYSANEVRVAVIVENNKSFAPNPDTLNYDLEITINDSETFFQQTLEHYHHARWRRVFWTGSDRPEHWPQGLRKAIYISHDGEYLQRTGAVPQYRDNTTVPESALESMWATFQTSSGTNGPELMQIGTLIDSMGQGGFQPPIGLQPRSVARYLVSDDERAKRVSVGNAEQSGSWSIHYRDQATGLPVSIDDHQGLNVEGWGCRFCEAPERAPSSAKKAGTFDVAHQPMPNAVPYLITGDYYLLEQLQFWATYDLLATKPTMDGRGRSAGVIHKNQQRGQAWALRTIAYAEYLTPDKHPMKAYWTDKLEHNRDWYTATYARGDKSGLEHAETLPGLGSYGNELGWIGRTVINRDPNKMSPWMDDFMTATVGQIANGFGYEGWDEFLEFKAQFPVARMADPQSDADGWCYKNAAAYRAYVSADEVQADAPSADTTSDGFFTSMLEVYRETSDQRGGSMWTTSPVDDCRSGRDEWLGRPASPTSYMANFTPAIAAAADSGISGAEAAYQRFCGRPLALQPTPREWGADPEWAIVPRSVTCSSAGIGDGGG